MILVSQRTTQQEHMVDHHTLYICHSARAGNMNTLYSNIANRIDFKFGILTDKRRFYLASICRLFLRQSQAEIAMISLSC